MPIAIDTESVRALIGQADDQVAEGAQRRDRAIPELALVDRVDQARPERSRRADLGEPGREQRRRVGRDLVGIDRLQRVHHALADAARRAR